MEILIIIQPIADLIHTLSMVLTVFIVIGFLGALLILSIDEDARKSEFAKFVKRKYRLIIGISAGILITGILTAPLTKPFEIYKHILIYRGINSETADKMVDNIDSLLELSHTKVREILEKSRKSD